MTDIAIRVDNIGKQYAIGGPQPRYRTIRDSLTSALVSPFRWLRPEKPEKLWALKDICLEIKHGEVVGFIGRNGAGKSTLLKVLSRITKPTTGRARIYGRVGSLLEVGTGFHPELTGRENIYLNGAILGMKRVEIERKFDEIIAFAEIERFLDTPVKHYSSGMYVRLAFAVAAHLEPEILLVDEVLAVGDAAFQKKCLGKMGQVAETGRTVIFVSHNMAAVRSLCSRAFLLSGGQITFSGPVGQVIERYLLAVSNDMSTHVQTDRITRPPIVSDDDSLRITRVGLKTSTEYAVLYTGEPLIVEMEFQTFRPLKDVVFGWAVFSGEGVFLFDSRSVQSYAAMPLLTPGSYTISSTLPANPLNPGLYSLHVGARNSLKGLDYLSDVMTFRVDSTEQFESIWMEAPRGLIRVNSSWTKPAIHTAVSTA